MALRSKLVLLAAVCLVAAAPAAAAGMPGQGRWIGVRKDGMHVSFTVQAAKGGQRFIAGEVWICDKPGSVADSADLLDFRSYAWRIASNGTIRTITAGKPPTSTISGRLGRAKGTIRLDATGSGCAAPTGTAIHVRRVRSWLARSGTWQLTGAYGTSVTFGVLGGAVVMAADGELDAYRQQGPWPDIGGSTCSRQGDGVFDDSWIAPDGAFQASEADLGLSGRFFTSSRADGGFQARWPDPACSTASVGFCVRLVKPQPPARVNRQALSSPGPRKRKCPPDRIREGRCCLPSPAP